MAARIFLSAVAGTMLSVAMALPIDLSNGSLTTDPDAPVHVNFNVQKVIIAESVSTSTSNNFTTPVTNTFSEPANMAAGEYDDYEDSLHYQEKERHDGHYSRYEHDEHYVHDDDDEEHPVHPPPSHRPARHHSPSRYYDESEYEEYVREHDRRYPRFEDWQREHERHPGLSYEEYEHEHQRPSFEEWRRNREYRNWHDDYDDYRYDHGKRPSYEDWEREHGRSSYDDWERRHGRHTIDDFDHDRETLSPPSYHQWEREHGRRVYEDWLRDHHHRNHRQEELDQERHEEAAEWDEAGHGDQTEHWEHWERTTHHNEDESEDVSSPHARSSRPSSGPSYSHSEETSSTPHRTSPHYSRPSHPGRGEIDLEDCDPEDFPFETSSIAKRGESNEAAAAVYKHVLSDM